LREAGANVATSRQPRPPGSAATRSSRAACWRNGRQDASYGL